MLARKIIVFHIAKHSVYLLGYWKQSARVLGIRKKKNYSFDENAVLILILILLLVFR